MKQRIRFAHVMRSSSGRTGAAVAAVAVGGALLMTIGAILPSGSRANEQEDSITFTIDATQDADTNRQLDVDPAEGQINFSRGDAYVVEGPIYRGHTIASRQANNDPKAPGAIGLYRLRATFLGSIDDFNRAIADDPTARVSFRSVRRCFLSLQMARPSSLKANGRMHMCPRAVQSSEERDGLRVGSEKRSKTILERTYKVSAMCV